VLKALAALLAIIGVITLGIFGPRWLMSEGVDPASQGRAGCDLLNDTCRWAQQGTNWQAQLQKNGALDQGTEYQLTITTDRDQPRVLAVLRGESMFLGEYPVPMARAGLTPDGKSQLWKATFTAPFCTTDPQMTWRVDLQSDINEEPVTPLKLTFTAEGRA